MEKKNNLFGNLFYIFVVYIVASYMGATWLCHANLQWKKDKIIDIGFNVLKKNGWSNI